MRSRIVPFILAFSLVSLALLVAGATKSPAPPSQTADHLAYHEHPSTGPLPATLDATQFQDNRAAFVSYSVAAQIRQILYQVPCYCPCSKIGHESLLDCFAGRHGVHCAICQKEAIFCYLQQTKGRTPAEIRRDLADGAIDRLNLVDEVKRLDQQLSLGDRGPTKDSAGLPSRAPIGKGGEKQ